MIEGDRATVTVRVPRAGQAKRVLLEREVVDVLGYRAWEKSGSHRASGRRERFPVVITDELTGRFRARVVYRDGKAATSRPARTSIWAWTPLTDFDRYYDTAGVWPFASHSFAINGTQYRGWGAHSSYPSWESRYTLGRHCRTLRGIAGLQDTSADGASGAISIVTDDVTTVWSSTLLTPGMSQALEVPLAMPYRLAIRAVNTSPAGTKTLTALGAPEALCTGV